MIIEVDIPKKGIYTYTIIGDIVECTKGEKVYRLDFAGQVWSCTCPGYTYRKNCSHKDHLPEEIKKEFNDKNKKFFPEGPCVEAAKNAYLILNGTRTSFYDLFWR